MQSVTIKLMSCVAHQFTNVAFSLGLCLGAMASPARGQTIEERDLPNDRVRTLIRLLDDADFTVRTRAEAELSRAGGSSISMIETAARRDPEQAARLVGVLERLMVGAADAENGRMWARAACNPTADALLTTLRVGDFGVSETSVAAEQSLERLAEQNSVVAGYSVAALNRHRVLRENRTIQELRRLGAKIVFHSDPELMGYELEGLGEPEPLKPDTIFSPPVHAVELVYILGDWKGGTEGLELLNRLRVHHLPSFVVYLIKGNGLTDDDVRAKAGQIPGLQVVDRGGAAMGFSSNQRFEDRCIISGLVEGLSAQKAGLRPGDEIVAIDGRWIDRSFNKLVVMLEEYRRGDVLPVLVVRSAPPGEIEEVDVTLSGWEDISDFAPQFWGR